MFLECPGIWVMGLMLAGKVRRRGTCGGSVLPAGGERGAGVRAGESHRLQSLWRLKHTKKEDGGRGRQHCMFPPAVAAGGQPGAGNLEDALFSAVREHAESMICWAKSGEALALEHDQLEEKTLAGGYELMRVLAESHMALRAAREQRRDDVADADGDARATAEDGQEHTRVMISGRCAPPGSPTAGGARRTCTRRTRT